MEQLILNRKRYHVFKPDMQFNMLNIIYVTLRMYVHTYRKDVIFMERRLLLSLNLLPLYGKICDQKVSQKVKMIILFLAMIQYEKMLTSKLYKVNKSAISPKRKIRSL